MRIFKTLGSISGDPEQEGYAIKFDTIEHEGKMWLVAGWLVSPSGKERRPERLICLENLPHQPTDPEEQGPNNPVHFVLNCSIPKSVLEGNVPLESEFEFVVLHRPDVHIPEPSEIQIH